MKLTEKEADRALKSLQILRREYDDYKNFRNELHIVHLEKLDETCRGAKVVIAKNEHRSFTLHLPYEVAMKWILEEMDKLEAQIELLKIKFKTEENV